VETKLWRNPEAHRTVVAQILEYAKNLTSWDYDSVDKAVKAYMTKRYGQPKSIYSTKGHAFSQAASRKARRKDFQKTFVFSYFRGYLKNFLPEKAQILLITD
jgi:hypothetical protein